MQPAPRHAFWSIVVASAALGDPGYRCLRAGSFTCGFHIAFQVTHRPSEIALSGPPVAAGGSAVGLIGLLV
jgi:hypothetical protein